MTVADKKSLAAADRDSSSELSVDDKTARFSVNDSEHVKGVFKQMTQEQKIQRRIKITQART